jgi:hypothetical protein
MDVTFFGYSYAQILTYNVSASLTPCMLTWCQWQSQLVTLNDESASAAPAAMSPASLCSLMHASWPW